MQTDVGNENPRYTNPIVVTISSQGRQIPTHVRLEASKRSGLKNDSFAKCEQLLTISKSRLTQKLGSVSQTELQNVFRSLVQVLGP
jgi:mRNA-degrading endonuclease toxin of MazEF toxin-antitoxin module